jgi:hypothetical protein
MIEYGSFIYLDVYRTGSSHVVSLLEAITAEKRLRLHRHASLTKGHPSGFSGGKRVFTTVRNPWDWYVSLWAYGADGKSAIRRYLTNQFDAKQVAALYGRDDPAAAFRRWLAVMHDPAVLQRVMQEHLPESRLAPVIGLYSYRFLRVTTLYPRLLLRRPVLRKPEDAASHLWRFKAYHEVLRSETLSDDLIGFVERNRTCFRPDAAELIRRADERPRNASTRSLGSYRDYYDDASAALVETRDRLFGDVFGYRF